MALILTEGFETYANASYLLLGTPKWDAGSTYEHFTSGAKTGQNFARSPNLTKTVAPGDEDDHFIAGVCHRVGYNVQTTLIAFYSDNGTVLHANLRRNVGGTLSILVGTTVVGTTTTIYSTSDWHFFELESVLHDTTGTINLFVDSNPTPVLTFTGDTKNGGADTTFDTFKILGGSFQFADDIYLMTGAGSAPYNAPVGEIRIYPLLPNGDGSSSDLVGSDGNSINNYLLVDEPVSSLNTADYVGAFPPGEYDLYALANLSITTGQILNFELNGYTQKSDSGAKSGRVKIKTGGTEFDGDTVALTTSVWSPLRRVWTLNPDTGLPWTIAEINALEVGFEVLA